MPLSYSTPVRRATLIVTSVALAAAALIGCASTPPPPNPALQGSWQLDTAASDDANALIAKAIRTAQKRIRRQRAAQGYGGGGPSGDNGSGPGDQDSGDLGEDLGATGRVGPDFQGLRDRLREELGSPRVLKFQLQPDDVQIQRDGLPAQDYQPGEKITRFEEYGTAQLNSTWKDQAFLLSQHYTSGARLEQSYALSASDSLVYTRSLRDPTVGRIDVKSVYRRAGP